MRQKAIDAVDILNDFVGDLIIGTMVLREYIKEERNGRVSLDLMIPIQKMCFSHLVLTLNKWLEFHLKYKQLVSTEHRHIVKALNSSLAHRKIEDFRNKCIGHIWNKDSNRPLTHSEIMDQLQIASGGNLTDFLAWINDPDKSYPDSVVTIIEKVRDSIMLEYGIEPAEFIER